MAMEPLEDQGGLQAGSETLAKTLGDWRGKKHTPRSLEAQSDRPQYLASQATEPELTLQRHRALLTFGRNIEQNRARSPDRFHLAMFPDVPCHKGPPHITIPQFPEDFTRAPM